MTQNDDYDKRAVRHLAEAFDTLVIWPTLTYSHAMLFGCHIHQPCHLADKSIVQKLHILPAERITLLLLLHRLHYNDILHYNVRLHYTDILYWNA